MSEIVDPARRIVPILTEVVSAGLRPLSAATGPAPSGASAIDAAELERRVLVEVQCRLAEGLEGPLRAVIEPLVGELVDTLLRETREQVVDTVRRMVREAVAQEQSLRQEG